MADAGKDRKFTANESALLAALGVPPLDQDLFLERARATKTKSLLKPLMEFQQYHKGQAKKQGPRSNVADASKGGFTANERALLAALGVPPLDQKLNSACGRCPPHPIYFWEGPKPPRVFMAFHGTMKCQRAKNTPRTKDPILMWLTLARTANSLYTPNATLQTTLSFLQRLFSRFVLLSSLEKGRTKNLNQLTASCAIHQRTTSHTASHSTASQILSLKMVLHESFTKQAKTATTPIDPAFIPAKPWIFPSSSSTLFCLWWKGL